MSKLRGITVTLITKQADGVDPFGKPVYKDVETAVGNVLVAPASSDDVVNQLNLTGRKAVYTLAIPKGDIHIWENQEVRFFGQRWRVFGIPIKGIDELVPLSWNTKVMVERYG